MADDSREHGEAGEGGARAERLQWRSRGRGLRVVVAGLTLLAGGSVAAAQPLVQRPHTPAGLALGVGFRTDVLSHRGLDPFSGDDAVTQLALTASQALTQMGMTGLAAGFEWNHGAVSADARGVPASLALDRLSVIVEAVRPLIGPLAGIARAGAGVLTAKARVEDGGGPAAPLGGASSSYSTRFWTPSVEASAGLAWRLGAGPVLWRSRLALSLRGDVGYVFSVARELTLTTEAEPVPGRTDEPLHLGGLAVRGAFARLQLAVTF